MRRRDALKLGAAAAAAATTGVAAQEAGGLEGLWPVAQTVLPTEIGPAGQKEALAAFMAWIHDHDPGRDLDHGYGHTRVEKSRAAPVDGYPAQLQALDAASKRQHGRAFASLDLAARQALIAEAFTVAKLGALGGRPSGAHVAADLMSHYFSSIEANDLCYEAEIGRDSCRSLAGSGERPEALAKAPRS